MNFKRKWLLLATAVLLMQQSGIFASDNELSSNSTSTGVSRHGIFHITASFLKVSEFTTPVRCIASVQADAARSAVVSVDYIWKGKPLTFVGQNAQCEFFIPYDIADIHPDGVMIRLVVQTDIAPLISFSPDLVGIYRSWLYPVGIPQNGTTLIQFGNRVL